MDYSLKENELNLNRKYSVSVGARSSDPNTECIKPNWHEKYEFIAVKRGSLTVTIDARRFEALENAIITIAPNYLHSATAGESGCEYITVSFDFKNLLDDSHYEQSLKNSIANQIIAISPIINDEIALSHLCNIYNITKTKSISQPIIEKGYSCIFFSYLLENFSVTQERHHTDNSKFNAILDYISQNFTRQITTKSIAERFSYNKSYFCRKFFEVTNVTPTEYILKLRIEHSQTLMTTTTISLSDIAQQCGFSSYPYFSSKFKQNIGISPAEWRDNFIKKNKV